MKKIAPYLLFLLVLLLAACSPAGSDGFSTVDSAGEGAYGGGDFIEFEMEESAPAAEPAAFDDSGFVRERGVTNTSAQSNGSNRVIIKNASLSISVEDPVEKMDSVLQLAEELGGFVVFSELYFRTLESGAEVPQASVTFRVPSDRLDEALAAVEEGAGQVLSKNVSGQDVTQEYTDLNSRLVTLKAAEAELLEIMDEAEDTEDVLSVFNQLINIQSEIEVLQGRIKYFEESAAFSAVSVEIVADEAVQPLTVGGWQPAGVAKEAVQALINTLTGLANIAIWLIVYLPVIAIFYFLFRWIWRRMRRSSEKRKSA